MSENEQQEWQKKVRLWYEKALAWRKKALKWHRDEKKRLALEKSG